MNTSTVTAFQNEYLATWTQSDPTLRSQKIRQLWASNGRLAVSSLGITLEGVEAICEHITGVHNDLIKGKELTFTYDQQIESGDSLLLRWSMLAPSGDVVARGADIIFRNADGQVESAYMFMGVN